MKNTHRFLSLLLVLLLACLVGCDSAQEATPDPIQPVDARLAVVDRVCEAVNKRDAGLVSAYIYDGLGDRHNQRHILERITGDYVTEEQRPFEREGDFVKSFPNKVEEIKKDIYEATQTVAEVQDVAAVPVSEVSGVKIYLIQIDGNWYVYGLER
ncbi:MAG: hypothetical protein E7527_03000 [Ruminococcaceae bacterium]|nr:hypothetical protein [Oscillospiraceae bacterium]